MFLRRGKTKSTLESSIDSALLAVEIYNKPRTPFRVEAYITHMIMAWTRLFHAHFHHTIGDKYYYKNIKGHYENIDGERKAWELRTCISKYAKISIPIEHNLLFFIKLRNKIEHRHIDKDEVGVMIFGECQSLLYNYETMLINFFGEEYALNESLAFSLQFSRMRQSSQLESSKKLLSKEVKELKNFIETYRFSLTDSVFNTLEYSIKLIEVPKISNTNRNDLSVDFVNWNSISQSDKDSYDKLTTIIKDKVIKKEVINPGKSKPGDIIKTVNSKSAFKINQHDHMCLYTCFKIRPTKKDDKDPFDTNTNYCRYDEVHNDYVYQDLWAEFIVKAINSGKLDQNLWKSKHSKNQYLNIKDFE
ncbi:DUF3644 domain-containing protein [Psychrobacter vallis]|uniref:DUF3644 domain-containing protein n=1 Tax=Psychrobacter vallis TaxID=248451 RepID=UPI001918C5A7|nr:DUF3644 domain-containing protein [Psychrobacter vallis]